jgi:prolyl-tRNA editing enzyme YbaK/EbsC (Cys-tRNA(Pro) deacylase)
MRVLLISANTEKINMPTLPMGLGDVAAAVRAAGHTVSFLEKTLLESGKNSMPLQILTSKELQQFIDAHQIQAAILPMDEHTPTVADAARALSVSTGQIIKSLVFLIQEEPLLVINNGLARVDRRKLAVGLGVARKRVRFADAQQALALTGFIVGSMPPFGHRQKMATLIDPAVLRLDVVFGGGGQIDAMMRLTSAELLRATGARVMDISE